MQKEPAVYVGECAMGITQTPDLLNLLLPIHPEDHVQGHPEAIHTLVEYGDYECPDCGKLFGIISDLRRESGSTLRIAFRHYPLSGIHPYAQLAAEAAEAASAQGRFWEMHDLLFEHQSVLTEKHLVRYAEELGLDVHRFRHELKNRVYEDRVREDFRRGVQNGVFSTPGLFLNGVRHSGAWDLESLRNVLERLE